MTNLFVTPRGSKKALCTLTLGGIVRIPGKFDGGRTPARRRN